ncbi:MAG: STAS domain-containing protein [Pseudomonadales bacterium]|nr:STAS domain-containing protein [Pseudomonadales bacterium]
MNVRSVFSPDNNNLKIEVTGKFDYSLLSKFREAYSDENHRDANITLDLRDTTSIDSSALGMLLNMRRYMGDQTDNIVIINCNTSVKKILMISRFDQQFSIE